MEGLPGVSHGNTEINVAARTRHYRGGVCGRGDCAFLAVLQGKALGLHESVHECGAGNQADYQADGVAGNHLAGAFARSSVFRPLSEVEPSQ